MRQFVLYEQPGSLGACPTLAGYADADIINQGVTCGANTLLNSDAVKRISEAWAKFETSFATVVGVEIGIYNVLGPSFIVGVLNDVGLAAVYDSLSTAVEGVLFDIGFEVAAAGGDTLGGAIAGSVVPVVGTIIGAIIGGIIAAVTAVAHHCTVQITNGTTVNCDQYVQNVKDAVLDIGSGTMSLVGVTPLMIADEYDLFLANPVWLFNNQNFLIPQGQPPPHDSGDIVTQIYDDLPGAFEILNRPQLANAAAQVGATPSKLPFWSSIPTPSIIPDPGDQSGAAWNELSHIGPLNWAPGDVTTELNNAGQYNYVYGACPNLTTNNAIWDVGGATVNPHSGLSNSGGKIIGYTDPPHNVYMLQVVYPSLTKSQCDKIFAKVQAAYIANFTAATAWANTQCSLTAADLGSGSFWNLDTPDVQAVLKQWSNPEPGCITRHDAVILMQAYVNTQCPPLPSVATLIMKSGYAIYEADAQRILKSWSNPKCISPVSKTAAKTSTAIKTTAVVAGLSAIGVVWYAARNKISVTKAAKQIYSNSKSFVGSKLKQVKRVTRKR